MTTNQELMAEAYRLQYEGMREGNEEKVLRAQNSYFQLLNQFPDDPQTIFLLATTYIQQGLNGVAINLLHRAAHFMPDSPEVWNNMGSAYKGENNNEKARECYEKAMALKEHPDYYNNLCTLYVNEGDPKPGLVYGYKGLQMDPDHHKLAWNVSLLELEEGNWKDGYAHYRQGILSGNRNIRDFSESEDVIPWWDGTKDQTVVVYGEQGIGDEIMFASALPDLIRDCKAVIFECHPRLIGMFQRSFPKVSAFYPTRKKDIISWVHNHPEIDAKLPIGDLFYWYRRNGKYPRKAYLTPDTELVEMYRDYVESLGDPPYIGFGWVGGSKVSHGHARTTKLGWYKDFLKQEGTFISLQYTDVVEKVARANKEHPFTLHHDPKIVKAYDYDHTLALACALDLVVAVNTSIVHLCGAAGVDCWTLTPHASAWRYRAGHHGDMSKMFQYGDWIRQIRMGQDESWDDVVARLAEEYRAWLKRYKASH